MGDHFVLLADHLLTESSLKDVIESKNRSNSANEAMVTNVYDHNMDLGIESLQMKLAECRICHDEDEDSNMETPCTCCGSLKYAHHNCVQRWCNEKGNTICEICLQPFKPNYTSPPPLFHCDSTPMNFRGNWEISRMDLHNLRFSATRSVGHDEPDTDENINPNSRSLICCRVVTIIFMALLVLRHTLPIVINFTGGYTLAILRATGVLLPIYIMVGVFLAFQHHKQTQVQEYITVDEENHLLHSPTHLHHIRVH